MARAAVNFHDSPPDGGGRSREFAVRDKLLGSGSGVRNQSMKVGTAPGSIGELAHAAVRVATHPADEPQVPTGRLVTFGRGRLALKIIAVPAPPKIKPTTTRPRPIQSTRLVFTPTLTAALTLLVAVAFIKTTAQVPPVTFQVVVILPVPLLAARQKF